MTFEQTIQASPFMLMEAAIVERLRRDLKIPLHPRLENALLIYTPEGRAALTALYREYIDIAKQATLPIALCTPTWRANKERLDCEGINSNVNADAVQFMKSFPDVFIGGLIGCKNDCYQPAEALSTEAAKEFHVWQISRLLDADFLYAVTLPEINEALGIAQAMAATDRPYIISFVIDKSGTILNGTPLEEAMQRIDAETARPPLGYGVNCCYPSFLQASILSDAAAKRMISIQANASSLSHEELDRAEQIQCDSLEDWSNRMLALHRSLGLNILGGCCGTNAGHLQSLVRHP